MFVQCRARMRRRQFESAARHRGISGYNRRKMQSLKIVLTCILGAVLYGIAHDQFTAHICVEYFSVFHPPLFPTQSPTLLALGWGVIATWWMGAFLGTMLALAARAGSRAKIAARELIGPIAKLLLVMGGLAAVAGLTGYALTRLGAIAPNEFVRAILPPSRHARFMADWWAHNTSYAVGSLGGIALCVATFRKRRSLSTSAELRPMQA